MKIIIACLCTLLLSINLWAQQINGKVTDMNDIPLIGATVVSSNSGYTTTNTKGEFKLNCDVGMEVTISYIGYNTFKKTIKSCSDQFLVKLEMSENKLDQVEITATSNKDKILLLQPKSIVKLDSNELKRGNGLFLDDAINTNVPGVYMQRRTSSAGQQFNIRGYGNGLGFKGANNNFDGQGTKVYYNGIPITDAEGVTVLDDIDFASVDKVEVSKGPSGSLYGLAIAGVVNLQTQKAEKNKTTIGENFLLGSYGLMRSTTSIAIGGENSSLLVNYGRQDFDGFMPHTASHKDFVNLMADISIRPKQSISTYFGFSNSYDERNGELTATQYENFDYSGNSRYIKNDAHSAVKSFRAGISHTYKFNKYVSNKTTFFGSSQLMDNSSAGGWSDKSPLSYGLRSTIDLNFNLSQSIELNSISGIEMQKTQSVANSYSMTLDSTNPSGYNVIGSLRGIQALSSATATYFTQWTISLPKDFSLTAGISLSSMNISTEDRLWALKNNKPGSTVPKKYERTFNGLVSPTLSINKRINHVASVYASYSIAYKTPVGSQFYIPYTNEVNQDLEAEKGTQIEVGTKGSMLNNQLFYSIALFNARFSNKLTSISVQDDANTSTLYSYVTNGGDLNNNGLEVLMKYEVMKNKNGFITSLKPFANVTYSDFKYDDFNYQKVGKGSLNQDTAIIENYNGNKVAGVPLLVFNAGIDLDTKIGVYANLNYNFRDKMYYTSDNLNETNSFALLNAKIGYRKTIKRLGLELYAGANNITAEQSYYMVFINQLPDAYIPAPNEINYFGGINLHYNF